MSNREKAIEQITKVLSKYWGSWGYANNQQRIEIITELLAIPGLRIEAEDQAPPKVATNWHNIMDAGWVKVEPKAGGKIDG